MTLHSTATRLWKSLPHDDRIAAAAAFFNEMPRELAGTALGVLAKARHMRPQAARALPPAAQAGILASVLDPGEPLAQGLLVSLHLGDRRPMLGSFLEALALPHDNGVLAEAAEAKLPASESDLRRAVAGLTAYPPTHVLTYLNTLWLQDPERWPALEHAGEWIGGERGADGTAG